MTPPQVPSFAPTKVAAGVAVVGDRSVSASTRAVAYAAAAIARALSRRLLVRFRKTPPPGETGSPPPPCRGTRARTLAHSDHSVPPIHRLRAHTRHFSDRFPSTHASPPPPPETVFIT